MIASRVATRKFTSLTILVVGWGRRVVPPRPVGPEDGQHLSMQSRVRRLFTMDVGRIDFCAAERFRRPRINLDVCPSHGAEDGARIIRGVDLRSIAVG
jgi:hypothetical protein